VSQTAINISLPPLFGNLAEYEGDVDVAVEHAKLNCRMTEVILALAMRDLIDGKQVGVFMPDGLARAKYLLASWLGDSGLKARKYSTTEDDCSFCSYSLGTGVLWLTQATRVPPASLPFFSLDQVYGVGCDTIKTDPRSLFPDSRFFLAGVLADRDHWFYGYCRMGDADAVSPSLGVSSEHTPVVLFRYDNVAVTQAFPEQKTFVPPQADPFYERHFLLQDVEPKYTTQSFIAFSRSRLHIRTDKPLDLLAETQREEAEGQHGTPVVALYVSRLQRRYLAMKRLAVAQGRRPWYLLLKYRRGGFTTIEQGQSYMVATTRPRSAVATLAHTSQSTQRIFRIAQLMHERDPEHPQRVGDSKSLLEFSNGSQFFIGTAGGHGFARGDTLQRVHGSEVSKWMRTKRASDESMANVEDLAAGLLGAASHGEVVFETTPNGREWFCIQYEEAKMGLNEFTPLFLRWFDDPMNRMELGTFDPEEVLETLNAQEKELIDKFGLDLAQIAFRRQQKKIYKRLFPQEMPEDDKTCFLASGVCFFDTDFILSLLEGLPLQENHGKVKSLPGGYEVRWKEPEDGHQYVAGVDTSEGLPGCDRSGIGILDKESGEQVASIHGLFNPRLLADHVVRICTDYNKAMVGIERENHGHAVIQRVLDLGYRKPHFRGGPMFFWDQKQDVRKSRAGWSTNPTTRPVMLEDLAEAIEGEHMTVNDHDFLGECLSFRLQGNGKFEADPGAHDDQVMKWAIAWQMRKHKRPKPRIAVVGG